MQLQIKIGQQKLLPTSPIHSLCPLACQRQLLLRQRCLSHSQISGIACSLVHQAEREPKQREQMLKGVLRSGVVPFSGVQESLLPRPSPIQLRSDVKCMPQQPPLPQEEAVLGFQLEQCPASKGCVENVLFPRAPWGQGDRSPPGHWHF